MYEAIEKLKREYTDKFVVVVGERPELARFVGHTGRVRTVNMNGQALVEFDAWSNTGWYDIAPEFLRIVPEPAPATVTQPVKASARPPESEKAPGSGEARRAGGVAENANEAPPAGGPAHGAEEPSVTHESGPEAAGR